LPTARKHQVNLEITRYYHCISRCVRRAFLCGYDKQITKNFDHRKRWLIDQMYSLAEIFSIKICAYAVMSNHYHIVFFVDKDEAIEWSHQEVINRWAKLFPMSKAKTWLELGLNLEELTADQVLYVEQLRVQLYDISWFMRKINEYIARQANQEDECTGRFWEGRFKSQALLDESAVLACMAYVDLNPIRAGLCSAPEDSKFTSIQARIRAYQAGEDIPIALCQFESIQSSEAECKKRDRAFIPCSFLDYLELVDTTGRLIQQGKRGTIPSSLSPILNRLHIKSESWVDTVICLAQSFATFMGRPESIESCMVELDRPGMRGLKQSRRVFTAVV